MDFIKKHIVQRPCETTVSLQIHFCLYTTGTDWKQSYFRQYNTFFYLHLHLYF